jgi:ubiquinone/menaquinone biosynthesis C-methylase UbiE
MVDDLTIPEQIGIWDRRGLDDQAYPQAVDQALVDRLRLIPAKLRMALDLGCGHGRHLVLLSSMGWRITGLDWSAMALEHAKRKLEAMGRYGSLVKADFRHLPFTNPAFHLVIATGTLNHGRLADFKRALQEIKRVLYPGGTALISVPTLNNAPLAPDGVWVEEHTLVMASGAEAGLPHHFFTEAEVHNCAPQFRTVEIAREVAPLPAGFKTLDEKHINEWFWITLAV